MASMTKIEKFQAKIDIEMDHVKASLIELRAKAKQAELDIKTEFEKGLDGLEKSQGEIKSKLNEWVKSGKGAAGDLKKTIKRSTKDLRKSVKKAYKSLT